MVGTSTSSRAQLAGEGLGLVLLCQDSHLLSRLSHWLHVAVLY